MAQEEEVLGKAYDSRLMRRLLTYLRPYRWRVAIAIAAIIFTAINPPLQVTPIATDEPPYETPR